MKIAFDVKGTIEGPKQKQVLELFWRLQKAGHEMFVWSNLFSYAAQAVIDHKLPAVALLKNSYNRSDDSAYGLMDIAIEDDRGQTWLGATKIVFVDELTDNIDFLVDELMGRLKLTHKDISIICDYLGDIAMTKADEGKPKEEKRIFDLIYKLEQLETEGK